MCKLVLDGGVFISLVGNTFRKWPQNLEIHESFPLHSTMAVLILAECVALWGEPEQTVVWVSCRLNYLASFLQQKSKLLEPPYLELLFLWTSILIKTA